MKKIFFIIIFFNLLFAECGVFTNVLQTRHLNSKITMSSTGSTGYIENANDCFLNTSYVYYDEYGHGLVCDINGNGIKDQNETMAKASGKYGKSLNIIYTHPFIYSEISSNPASLTSKNEIIGDNIILSLSEYNSISTDWHGPYDVTFDFNGDKKINNILNIKSNFIFKNNTNIEIGTIQTKGTDNFARFIFQNTPQIIKINNINAESQIEANFSATNELDIGDATFYGNETNITFSAPKVVINNRLVFSSGGNGNAQITIKADEIYINDIYFERTSGYQLLKIEPYTPGKKILFVVNNKITTGNNSHILVSSGDYYIGGFDLSASEGYTVIKASNENQNVNLYINDKLYVPSAVGFNTNGVGDNNFGNNPSANFKIFINGDLEAVSRTAFNALIYLEGKTNLDSAVYVRGAISSGDDITIGNNSKFYWDKSIESLEESKKCLPPVASYDYNYVCGIFKGPLVTYDTIQGNGVYPKVCGSLTLYALKVNNIDKIKCTVNLDCSNANTCNTMSPPVNRYNPKFIESAQINEIPDNLIFTDKDYKNYTFTQDDLVLNFEPDINYSDNSTKYSTFGAWTFNGNNITLNFYPGDYYFDSLKFDGSNVKINVINGGPVRIFVKENLQFYQNNILINNGDENNLFIYVGGNLEFKNTDDNPIYVHAFAYVKGNVEFKSNSQNFYWYGGVTAEGDITIDSNYAHFIYRGISNKLGYGKCHLCYALNFRGSWINKFQFFNSSIEFDFPRKIGIINDSNQTLYDLNVSQIETNPAWFSITSPERYYIFDQNNTIPKKHIQNTITYSWETAITSGTISHTKESDYGEVIRWAPAVDVLGLLNTELNTTANFGEYESGGFDRYLGIATDLINAKFMGGNNLKFYATYYDNQNRKYSVELEYCYIESHGVYNDKTGPFDAWDIDKDINNRIITTKIVNKVFNLTLASLNDSNTSLEKKDVGYVNVAIYDMLSGQKISNTVLFDTNSSDEVNKTFIVNRGSKDARVGFLICSYYDSNSKKHYVYDYSKCNGNIESCNEEGLHFRICYSTDNFAIRPYKYKITPITTPLKAGDDFSLIIKALDYNGAPVVGYNESINITTKTSAYLDYNDTNASKGCNRGNLDFALGSNTQFVNGYANVRLKYSEVGDLNITIKEINSTEFAKVDINDTSDRFIKPDSILLKFIPYDFIITSSFDNFNNGNFTYLSNNLLDNNMSATLGITLKAVNKDSVVLQNYNKNCYAKDIAFSALYNYNATDINNPKYLLVNDDKNLTTTKTLAKTKVFSRVLSKNYFETNGLANINIHINFSKDYKNPINPFDMNITQMSFNDGDINKNLTLLTSNVTFYYGRIFAPNISGYPKKVGSNYQLSSDFIYQYWVDEWKTNKDHNSSYGVVKDYYPKNIVTLNLNTINNGDQNISVSTNKIPISEKLHLSIPSYLWYHPLAKDYKDPSATNLDCLTHPCFKVDFLKQSSGWGGIGVDSNTTKYNEENRTVKTKSNIKTDKNSFKKINW